MKRLMTVMMVLFAMSGMVEAQEVLYKAGATVKGKDVTYKIRIRKNTINLLLVRNINNPDTTLKPIPRRYGSTEYVGKIIKQIAKIIHKNLTPEEFALVKRTKEWVGMVLRTDRVKHKLMQVTCFEFFPLGAGRSSGDPMPDECFWLSLDPDRLHEIERAIVEEVRLPETLQKTYLTDDFEVLLSNEEIIGLEKVWEERKKMAAKQNTKNMVADDFSAGISEL